MEFVPENSPAKQVFAGSAGGVSLITPRGDPIPPSDVVAELERISPRLSLKWQNSAWGASYFALFEEWAPGDKRWERVQAGEISRENARDILTMFPREIRTGEMVAWVRNRWGERGIVKDPRAEAERMVAEGQRRLQALQESQVDQAVETGTQRILDESDHTRLVRAGAERPHPMVHGSDFSPTPEFKPKSLFDAATS